MSILVWIGRCFVPLSPLRWIVFSHKPVGALPRLKGHDDRPGHTHAAKVLRFADFHVCLDRLIALSPNDDAVVRLIVPTVASLGVVEAQSLIGLSLPDALLGWTTMMITT